jgi:signal peptidase I
MNIVLTPDELKARQRRNVWIALAITAFIVLVFFISMVKVESGIVAGGS